MKTFFSSRKLKKQLEDALQKVETTPYAAALDNTLGEVLLSKVLAGILISAVEKATEEWYLISSYFVPGMPDQWIGHH